MSRFEQPLFPKARPGSHRFESLSPKLNRRVVFFDQWHVEQWLLLEADPEVIRFCERPCSLQPKSSKRLIDFWVKTRSEEYGLLMLTTQESDFKAEESIHASIDVIRLVSAETLKRFEQRIHNWRMILPYLIANRTLITQDLTDAVTDLLYKPQTLGDVEHHFRGRDIVLVRAALFKILHQGFYYRTH